MKLLSPLKRILGHGLFGFCLFGALLSSGEVFAVAVVKLNGTAARGECLPAPATQPAEILKRNQISATGAKELELAALAKVIVAIEKIGDGRFKFHHGAKYRFLSDGKARSNYDGSFLNIRDGGQNRAGLVAGLDLSISEKAQGDIQHSPTGRGNHALLVHELGHYIGHRNHSATSAQGGTSLYTHYRNSVAKCNISGYATNDKTRRHEEFAEVFAAYVTNPKMLTEVKGCSEAIDFFAKLFGENAPAKDCSSRIASVDIELQPQTTAGLGQP